MGRTLAQKIWDSRVVRSADGEPDLLFIDLHLVHEVTSPQAFDGLRLAGRGVRRPDLTIATEDHNVPTLGVSGPGLPLIGPGSPVTDPVSRVQVEALRKNCAEFGIRLFPMGDAGQGIVHVISPQLGLTQPGMTIVCGDSHTSTHGALGALAFGIGTSEVEHVFTTQTLPQARPGQMAVNVAGDLPYGVTAKDLILAVIAQIGTGGGVGHVIEYRGPAIRQLSMAGRMTVCNMSIEAGARRASSRPTTPPSATWKGARTPRRGRLGGGARLLAVAADRSRCRVRPGGHPGCGGPHPVRDLGHQPGPGQARWPRLCRTRSPWPTRARALRPSAPSPTWTSGRERRSLISGSTPCSSGRAQTGGWRICGRPPTCCAGRKVSDGVRMLVVPGSMEVKAAAEREGLDAVFTDQQGANGGRRAAPCAWA